MIEQLSFKRLILRAVLRHVSPMAKECFWADSRGFYRLRKVKKSGYSLCIGKWLQKKAARRGERRAFFAPWSRDAFDVPRLLIFRIPIRCRDCGDRTHASSARWPGSVFAK